MEFQTSRTLRKCKHSQSEHFRKESQTLIKLREGEQALRKLDQKIAPSSTSKNQLCTNRFWQFSSEFILQTSTLKQFQIHFGARRALSYSETLANEQAKQKPTLKA
ncbi:hypothetical protein TEU_04580 [Thermococcus eurythermalis]|uniref:Uncharacterized protein n=1 Tax=Thermococcus eurythermalis TaxID=1505907 RepID=A0A097QT69_9EURY|nr:hypothetical protein TEU_04580 [Thermococcus eurythermalis]